MFRNKKIILIALCLPMMFSCGKHAKLLKSTNNELKYQAAMSYYEKKDYNRALELFDMLQSAYRGKPQGEEIAFLTAECYFQLEDYSIASHYYKRYASTYPFGKRTEDALYKSAYCYYLESPNISLDQTDTHNAIREFQQFIDAYPSSDYVDDANARIDTLRLKLEEKDFNKAMLYYKMDEYQAAITTFEAFLADYPATLHREEILVYMVMTYYHYAEKSVADKQRERYELALEKYNTLSYIFPDSEKLKELAPVVEKMRARLARMENNNK